MKKLFLLGLLLLSCICLNPETYAQETEHLQSSYDNIEIAESQVTDSELTVSDNVSINNDKENIDITSSTAPEEDFVEVNIEKSVPEVKEVEELDETDAIFLDFQNSPKGQKVIIKEITSSDDIKKEFMSKTDKEYIKTTNSLEYKLNTNLSLKDSEITQEPKQNQDNTKTCCEKEKTQTIKNPLLKTVTGKSVEIKFGVDNTNRFTP